MSSSTAFAAALELCIRDAAQHAAATVPEWGNSCMPPTEKIDRQAQVLNRTLPAIRSDYGYAPALWCALWSVRMTGKEYDPNDSQPNNPNIKDWIDSLMCPWGAASACSDDELGLNGDEWKGVPASGAPKINAQYPVKYNRNAPGWNIVFEPARRTMSCGLCGHLKRKLGAPPLILEAAVVTDDPGNEHLYTANWDLHPFGAWLANEAARKARDAGLNAAGRREAVMAIVADINIYKASNGEETHGFLWQSTRLLAYQDGTLSSHRRDQSSLPEAVAVRHVLRVCEPTWGLAAQTRDDCSHAAGHGFFYYFLDVGRAVTACWSDLIMEHTPGDEWDENKEWYMQPKLTALKLLQWRWLCATGVYHAAGNTLSLELFDILSRMEPTPPPPDTTAEHTTAAGHTVEQYLCKHANVWGDSTRYFDRCAAGLGIKEAESRLDAVRRGVCSPRLKEAPTGGPASGSAGTSADEQVPARPPAEWETRQLLQYGPTQQLSCDPAQYFVVAIATCPLAFRAHWPCDPSSLDAKFCLPGPKAPPNNGAPFHELCISHEVLRTTFLCEKPPHFSRSALTSATAAAAATKPLATLDPALDPMLRASQSSNRVGYAWGWKFGTPLGVWGGVCTCPDGRKYTVGDEGNICGSIACHGGRQGPCQKQQGRCRPPRLPM